MTCAIPCNALLNFLSLFSSIVSLDLCNIHPYRRLNSSSSRISPMLSHLVIHELSGMCTPIAFIREVVRRTRVAETVKKVLLTACVTTWEEADELGEVLVRTRSTLRRLAILPAIVDEFANLQESDRPLWERMNIPRCVALQTLDLTIYSKHRTRALPLLAVYLAAIMASPASLRTLNIFLTVLPSSYDLPFDPALVRAFWENRDKMVLERGPRYLVINLDLVPLYSAQPTKAELDTFKTFIADRFPCSVMQGRLRVLEG
ncbi:hypothetical protein C8T65DRAFT_701482 [Cerioporus squamosus]|nr:hypothetical protein C8T65DRAFT_701482 [Cerioporus squamosus]